MKVLNKTLLSVKQKYEKSDLSKYFLEVEGITFDDIGVYEFVKEKGTYKKLQDTKIDLYIVVEGEAVTLEYPL